MQKWSVVDQNKSASLTNFGYAKIKMKTEAKGVSPEVVAAISAAVQMMTSNQVIAVRIKRSDIWAMSARGGLAKPL